MSDRDVLRREFLGALGATAAAGLAGCSGGDESTESGSTSSTPQKTSQGNAQGSSGEGSQVTDQNTTDRPDDASNQTNDSELGAGEYPQSESEGFESEYETALSGRGAWGLEIGDFDFLNYSTHPEANPDNLTNFDESLYLAAEDSETVYIIFPPLEEDARSKTSINLGGIEFSGDGINDVGRIDGTPEQQIEEGSYVGEPSLSEAEEIYSSFLRDHVNPEGRSKSVFAEEAVVDSFGTVPEYAREPLLSESSQ